ncbi:MAG: integrase arm-type DNA-binding domain-containing protein [Desulfovibrio sp.]|jgi:hypothetical protein|nr:integrase arm-type DNA-binding domain-containing protein [Desulfovibrio sp.]
MLTDKAITQAKPREKIYRLSDQTGNGLYLEVTPAGKHWRFRYRFRGKAKMIGLGTYPLVTLREAREKALEARKVLVGGVDPSSLKKTSRGESQGIFRDVAREWWERFASTSTPKYSGEVWSNLERNVFPLIGDMHIAEIDAPTVLAVLRRIEERGTFTSMHKVRSYISQIFRYGIACGLVYSDPSRDLSNALHRKRSTPRAALVDPAQIGLLMVAIEEYPRVIVRCALKLAAYTFVRPRSLSDFKFYKIYNYAFQYLYKRDCF